MTDARNRPAGFTLVERPFGRLSSSLSLRAEGRTTQHGFTLVELLVVVAIIALLLGILLPALGAAREVARTTVCAMNMRQVAIGFVMYADGNSGASVPGRPYKVNPKTDPANMYDVGNGMQYRPRWFITLGAQSGIHAYEEPSTDPADDNVKTVDHKVFICPQAPERINNRNFSYGYNFQFLGNARSHPSRAFMNFPVDISRINPSSTVMAADNLGTAAGKAEDNRLPYNVTGQNNDTRQVSNHGWSLDPPRLVAGDSDFCDNNNRNAADRSGPDPRHGGKANASFCDGHVETRSPEKLGYHVNDDGSYALDGPNVTNRLFSGTGEDADPPSIH